jgi:hypothetical protein
VRSGPELPSRESKQPQWPGTCGRRRRRSRARCTHQHRQRRPPKSNPVDSLRSTEPGAERHWIPVAPFIGDTGFVQWRPRGATRRGGREEVGDGGAARVSSPVAWRTRREEQGSFSRRRRAPVLDGPLPRLSACPHNTGSGGGVFCPVWGAPAPFLIWGATIPSHTPIPKRLIGESWRRGHRSGAATSTSDALASPRQGTRVPGTRRPRLQARAASPC